MISKILPRWKYTGNTQTTTLKEWLGGLQSTAKLSCLLTDLHGTTLFSHSKWCEELICWINILFLQRLGGALPVNPLECSAVMMLALLLPPLISQFIFSQLRFEYEESPKQKLSSRTGEIRTRDRDRHISDLTRARLLLKLFELETQRIKHGFFRTQFLLASAQHHHPVSEQRASWSAIRHGGGSSVGWQNIYDKFKIQQKINNRGAWLGYGYMVL